MPEKRAAPPGMGPAHVLDGMAAITESANRKAEHPPPKQSSPAAGVRYRGTPASTRTGTWLKVSGLKRGYMPQIGITNINTSQRVNPII